MATKKAEKIVEVKNFTFPEILMGIKKINKRIDEVKKLAETKASYNDPRVETAEKNIRETVRDVFGQYSPEFYDFEYHDIWDGSYIMGDDEYDMQTKFEAGIPKTTGLLEGLIGRLEEKKEDFTDIDETKPAPVVGTNISENKKVFIVHGHDEESKSILARFIEKLQLEPVILSEKPSEGLTIIEKFETNSDVGYAIVLLTPDDIAFEKDHPEKQTSRARQNAILELGYFVGKLGRAKVCALCKGNVEIPSDFHGVIYISMDAAGGWMIKLAAEIKTAGLAIDMNKVL